MKKNNHHSDIHEKGGKINKGGKRIIILQEMEKIQRKKDYEMSKGKN